MRHIDNPGLTEAYKTSLKSKAEAQALSLGYETFDPEHYKTLELNKPIRGILNHYKEYMKTGPLQAGPEAVKEIEELELSKHTKDKLLELNGKSSKDLNDYALADINAFENLIKKPGGIARYKDYIKARKQIDRIQAGGAELNKNTEELDKLIAQVKGHEPTEVPNTLNTPVTISQPTSQPTGGQSTGGQSTGGQANNYWPEKIIGGTVAGGLATGTGYYLYKKRNNG